MEPLGHGAIRFPHLSDLRKQSAFPVRLVRPQLLDAILHRSSFLVRESLELLAGRGGALGGLLRVHLWAHRKTPRSEHHNERACVVRITLALTGGCRGPPARSPCGTWRGGRGQRDVIRKQ